MSINTGLDLKTSFFREKEVYNKSEISSILMQQVTFGIALSKKLP